MPPLWHSYIDFIAEDTPCASPDGQDRERVRSLFAEMYLVGERPTVAEIRGVIQRRYGSVSDFWSSVLALWGERIRDPRRRLRSGYAWKYPFVLAEMFLEGAADDSVMSRLETQVGNA